MPTLVEKLQKESENEQHIYLYKEGNFWRAYNVSCMHFFRAFPHIKVLCNISKNGSYVLLGIPDSKIQEYKEKLREKNWEINNQSSNETFLEFVGVEKIEKEEYEMFLHTQMSKQKEKETQKSRIIVISNEKTAYLIEKIKNIEIDTTTPVEALVILKEIKNYIYELGL